jgi:ABC-type polysaccharide/polyol phosphate transport system ATPase subunit
LTARAAAATDGLVATGLGKAYRLSRSRLRPLLRALIRPGPPDFTAGAFWALRGVSFSLPRGQSLGVIGRNGSGKSTLLRLLSGTARPTEGRVEIGARLGCLLELGTGFRPLETGRQNAEDWLVLVGGMSRSEARRAMAEVERFAGIGAFFDRPLRTYSAGMQLRIAFATAATLEPEILIADEVLAVGDETFQRRCNGFFDRFLARGGSLVLCAHDLYQVQRLCERSLWLDAGRIREIGETRTVVRHYREEAGGIAAGTGSGEERDVGARHGVGEVAGLPFEVVDLHLLDASGNEVRAIDPGATVVVVADVLAQAAVPHVHVSFTREDMVPVYGISSDMDGVEPTPLGGDRHRFRLTFDELPLVAGRYVLKAHALDETATRLYDTVEIGFVVRGESADSGLVRLAVDWR